jgi:hypothetical protein
MPSRSEWGLTPRESIDLECARRGTAELVAGCVALLTGEPAHDGRLVAAIAGPAGQPPPDGARRYWLRVWGARALLYAWDDGNDAAPAAIRAALADEAWRVREMAAKVVAKRVIGMALADVARLRDDPVPRVRQAGQRATVILTAAGA